jgi:hypothetical protein
MVHLAHKNLAQKQLHPLIIRGVLKGLIKRGLVFNYLGAILIHYLSKISMSLPVIQGFEGLIIFRLFACKWSIISNVHFAYILWVGRLLNHRLFKTSFLMIQRSFLRTFNQVRFWVLTSVVSGNGLGLTFFV